MFQWIKSTWAIIVPIIYHFIILVIKDLFLNFPFIRVRFFVAVNFNYQSKKWMQENLNGTKVEVSATGKEYVKASLQKWTVQTLDLNGCNCASFKQLGYQALV